jgi:ribosomal-protein-alanine N-acetyltransferase
VNESGQPPAISPRAQDRCRGHRRDVAPAHRARSALALDAGARPQADRRSRDHGARRVAGRRDGRLRHHALRRSHLFLLAVAPWCRRTGIGRALLEWLEKSCRTAGIRNVRLEVRWGNRQARRFYLDNSYRVLGQIAGYYDRREAAVLMGKSLMPPPENDPNL